MAKISEQKKVELLETAVLENDTAAVKSLFEEYDEFDPKLFAGYCGNKAMEAIGRIIPGQEPVAAE